MEFEKVFKKLPIEKQVEILEKYRFYQKIDSFKNWFNRLFGCEEENTICLMREMSDGKIDVMFVTRRGHPKTNRRSKVAGTGCQMKFKKKY